MTSDAENKEITTEVGEEKQAKAKQPSKPRPQLPDGWGISLKEYRAILAVEHGTDIAEDDPTMMVGTLVNLATYEFDKMLKKHELALKRMFIEESKKYMDTVDTLSKSLSSTSAKAAQDVFRRHSMTVNTLRNQLWWMIGVVILTTLIHLAAGFIIV